jgi:hypothetical protein
MRLFRVRWASEADAPEFLVAPEDLRFGVRTSSRSLALNMTVAPADAAEVHVPYFPAGDGWLNEVSVLGELTEMRLVEVARSSPRNPRSPRRHVLKGVPNLAGEDRPASAVLDRLLFRRGIAAPEVPVETPFPKRFAPVSIEEFESVRRAFFPHPTDGAA